jgi:co-chaperonin GroES (HSP10)
VLIKQVDAPKQKGLIAIPDSVQQKYVEGRGTVLAVGSRAGKVRPDALYGEGSEPEVKVGDQVLYNKWDASDVKVDDVVFHLVEYDKLLLRLPKVEQPETRQ